MISGTVAAVGVVVLRLALPWPFRVVLEPVLTGTSPTVVSVSELSWLVHPSVMMAGAAFFLLAAALGWADYRERLHFARFAIGLVKDLRARVVNTLIGHGQSNQIPPSGDLVARLVGDTARVKAGLKGFLVHVATNLLLFVGVVVILSWIDLRLGLVFTAAGSLAILATMIGAVKIYQCARKHRRKEGKMAEAVNAVRGAVVSDKVLSRVNTASQRYEAQVTRLQGQTTWVAHTILGFAVVGALLVGWHGFTVGRLSPGDLFICMAYMLMLRAPMVQLTRQGARTGKISAALERVTALIQDKSPGIASVHHPPRNWIRLRLKDTKVKASRRYGRHRRLGSLNLTIRRGERTAIVGPSGSGKSTLLALIAGTVRPKKGVVAWEADTDTQIGASDSSTPQIGLSPENPVWRRCHLGRFLGLEFEPVADDPKIVLRDWGLQGLLNRLPDGLESRISAYALSIGERKLVSALHVANSDATIKLFDEPAILLSRSKGARFIRRILDTAVDNTVLITFSRAHAVSDFDRIIKLRRGKITFDGSPERWRQKRMSEKGMKLQPSATLGG